MKLSVRRLWVQIASAVASNSWFAGFANGTIFKGRLKYACLPGLNCYSCPGAVGSCPVGALQAVIGSRSYDFSFYVTGLLLLFGLAAGRWICGWLCPFGLLQDLLHRIPGRKVRVPAGLRGLRFAKYAVLLLLVVLLPLLAVNYAGQGDPWFCKYLCPAGTIQGALPLLITNEPLRSAAGWLLTWKTAVALAVVALSIVLYRFFCRFLCPLGAIYGLMNRLALYRLRVARQRCAGCGACARACRMEVDPSRDPNSAECIRCGECVKACPRQALSMGFPKEYKVTRSADCGKAHQNHHR